MNDSMNDYMNLFSPDSQRRLMNLSDLPATPVPSEAEQDTGFFANLGASWWNSVGMRGAGRVRRRLDILNTNNFNQPGRRAADPDLFFRANEEYILSQGVAGRYVIDRYLAGAYDGIKTDDALYAALTMDQAEGLRVQTMSRANGFGVVGGFGGALLDPTNALLAYGLPLAAGTARGIAAGSGVAGSLRAGQSVATGSPTLAGSAATGLGMSAVQNAADLVMTPREDSFGDYVGQVAVDLAADAALSYGLRAASYGLSRLGDLKTRAGESNNALADALAPAMDAELLAAAAVNPPSSLPPPPLQTEVALSQRSVLDGLPQTAEIRALRRAVDQGISPLEFDERLSLIRQGARDLQDAPLFAVEMEGTQADGRAVNPNPNRVNDSVAGQTESEITSIDRRDSIEPPPDPDRIDPATGRPIYNTRAAAQAAKDAEGLLFPMAEDNLSQAVDALSPEARADAVLALSPEEVSQLNRIMQAMEKSQTVPLEDFNAHVADVLEKINNRSPNLKWNPASLGAPGTVYSVKLTQPVNAEVVGFVPTTPLEDLMLALKKLGFGQRDGVTADAPPESFRGKHVRRNGAGGWYTVGEADLVAENLLSFTGRARDYKDLLPDFRNDAVRQTVNKLSGDRISENSKGVLGFQGAWGPFANRLAFSKNPVLSHFFGVLAASDVHTRGISDSYRLSAPLETISAANRVQQIRQQAVIERGFSDYLEAVAPNKNLAGRAFQRLRDSNGRLSPNLMTAAERQVWDDFNHQLETLRIAANSLGVEGGRIAWLESRAGTGSQWVNEMSVAQPWLTQTRWEITPEAAEPLRATLVRMLKEERAEFEKPTATRMAAQTTTVDLSPDLTFDELRPLLRDLQGLPQDADADKIFDVYLRLTNGNAPLISRADFEAAKLGTETEKFKRAVISAHNQRLRGIVPVQNAAAVTGSYYALVRQVQGQRPPAQLSAADAAAVRWELETRMEWATALAKSLAVLRDLELRTTPGYDLLDPALDGYASIIRWRSQGLWREFADGVEQWIDTAIQAHLSHAQRWALLNEPDPKVRARLDADAKAADEFGSMMVGHYKTESRGEAQKLGLAARDLTSMVLLGKQSLAQMPEIARTLARATSLGTAKMIQPLVVGIRNDIARMARNGEDLGPLLNQVESIQEGMSLHIARRMDLVADGKENGSMPDASWVDRFGTWVKVKGRGMIFVASLGNRVNNITAVASTLIANERFSVDLPKAQRVAERMSKGESAVAATQAEGIGYPEFQYIRRYLSDDSLNRLVSLMAEGSKAKVFNSKGEEIVEVWAPRDRTDRVAMTEYATLIGRYADRQIRFVPGAVDTFKTGDPQGVIVNWMTQFLKPTIAGTNALVLSRANASVGNRLTEMGAVALLSFVGQYLRSVVSGRDQEFGEEVKTLSGLSRQIQDSLGYAGIIGWIPDRFGSAVFSSILGGDDFRSRRSVDFAVDTPVQSVAKRTVAAFGGALTGDVSPGEFLYLRRWLTAGLSDTVMAHLLRVIVDDTGLSDAVRIDEAIDWIYPETVEQRSVVERVFGTE